MTNNTYKLIIITLILTPIIIMITRSQQSAKTETYTLPPIDFSLDEEPKKGEPLRMAHSYQVEFSPASVGTWKNLDDDTLLWRFEIVSPNATSLNLGFTNYFMPDEGELFIYTANMQTIVGPFTAKDNSPRLRGAEHKQLWTPILPSNHIIIEVIIPKNKQSLFQLELTSINAGFR